MEEWGVTVLWGLRAAGGRGGGRRKRQAAGGINRGGIYAVGSPSRGMQELRARRCSGLPVTCGIDPDTSVYT